MSNQFYYAQPGPITPIALVGQKIAVWTPPFWTCYKVIFYEGYPRSSPLVFNLGAPAAGASLPDVRLTTLAMGDEPPEMAQLRFYPIDDLEVTIKRGTSDVRHKSKNITTRADRFTVEVDPCLHTTEFVVLKGEEPHVDSINPTGYALLQARVAFFGFRLILEDLKFSRNTVDEVEKQLAPITFVAAGGI